MSEGTIAFTLSNCTSGVISGYSLTTISQVGGTGAPAYCSTNNLSNAQFVYITTDSIHLHGQTVPLQRENRTTFTEGVPLHINFL